MNQSLYTIPLTRINGTETSLSTYAGNVLLIVNVASKCGLTPQYEGLESLYEKYSDQKFSVLGFPANDFAGQEPGSNDEIQNFCTLNYSVKFPLFGKISVTGAAKHPLFEHLVSEKPETEDRERMEAMLRSYKMTPTETPEVLWNFEKFLIARNGRVVRRFSPDTAPDAQKLIEAIETELLRD